MEGEALCEGQDDATRVAIRDQERAGIDIVSDGEQRRTSYARAVIEAMGGFDFEHTQRKTIRNGRATVEAPRCVEPIRHQHPIALADLRFLRRP